MAEPRPLQTAAAADPRDRLIAIGLLAIAMLCFSLLDSCAKWLGPRIGTIETTWFRYVTAMLFASVYLNPVGRPAIMISSRPWLQFWRSIALMLSSLFNFLAIQELQLAQAISINFLMPLLVAVLAGPLLGEWIGWRRMIAVAIGFCGVLVVTRPWSGSIQPGMLWALAAAFAYAGYALLTRMLAALDSSDTTNFYSNTAAVILLAPLIPFVWVQPPSAYAVLLIILTGVFGGGGHFMIVAAYKRAEASRLAPFTYMQIVWMTLMGWLFFNEVPDRWTFLGAAIIIACGLYLLHRERTVGPRRRPLGD